MANTSATLPLRTSINDFTFALTLRQKSGFLFGTNMPAPPSRPATDLDHIRLGAAERQAAHVHRMTGHTLPALATHALHAGAAAAAAHAAAAAPAAGARVAVVLVVVGLEA